MIIFFHFVNHIFQIKHNKHHTKIESSSKWTDDETSCNQDTEFECDGGRCIPISHKCDDIEDCHDGTDEQNCENVHEGSFYSFEL